ISTRSSAAMTRTNAMTLVFMNYGTSRASAWPWRNRPPLIGRVGDAAQSASDRRHWARSRLTSRPSVRRAGHSAEGHAHEVDVVGCPFGHREEHLFADVT